MSVYLMVKVVIWLIDIKNTESIIVAGLSEFVNCAVIASNQTAPAPDYPYVSYTVTTALDSNVKGFCIAADGTRYKELNQIWSFTSQSDDSIESVSNALRIKDYFDLAGNTYLSDNQIVAVKTGNIFNRDNIITINYEYRNGLDVTFRLLDVIKKEDAETAGYIETAVINNKEW